MPMQPSHAQHAFFFFRWWWWWWWRLVEHGYVHAATVCSLRFQNKLKKVTSASISEPSSARQILCKINPRPFVTDFENLSHHSRNLQISKDHMNLVNKIKSKKINFFKWTKNHRAIVQMTQILHSLLTLRMPQQLPLLIWPKPGFPYKMTF